MSNICKFCNKESNLISFAEDEIEVFPTLKDVKYCGDKECRHRAMNEAHKIWADQCVVEIEQERKEMKEQGFKYAYELFD